MWIVVINIIVGVVCYLILDLRVINSNKQSHTVGCIRYQTVQLTRPRKTIAYSMEDRQTTVHRGTEHPQI